MCVTEEAEDPTYKPSSEESEEKERSSEESEEKERKKRAASRLVLLIRRNLTSAPSAASCTKESLGLHSCKVFINHQIKVDEQQPPVTKG